MYMFNLVGKFPDSLRAFLRHYSKQIHTGATFMWYENGIVQTSIRWTIDNRRVQLFQWFHHQLVQPDRSGFISQGWALLITEKVLKRPETINTIFWYLFLTPSLKFLNFSRLTNCQYKSQHHNIGLVYTIRMAQFLLCLRWQSISRN